MAKKTRTTRQKELLERIIKSFNRFFTAEELYAEAKKTDKKIGIATIYRFLNDNSGNAHIHSYNCNRRKIFSTKTDNHCHFICKKCNKVEHFNISKVDFLKGKSWSVCHFQIDVHGICNKCGKTDQK